MKQFTAKVNGQSLTVDVDMSDFPKFIIDGATDSEGNEVELTPEVLCDLYDTLSPEVAAERYR